jgi:hypothetical protein
LFIAFTVHLTTLSVTQTVSRRTVGWLKNNKWDVRGRNNCVPVGVPPLAFAWRFLAKSWKL